MSIIESLKSENKQDVVLSEMLKTLVDKLVESTEFSSSEIKAISFLSVDMMFAPYLKEFISNKKYLKRQLNKEITTLVESISKCIQSSNGNNFNFAMENERKRR